MKSKVIVFIILMLFALPVIKAFSQNRNVVWVHGFCGDATSLQHYATIFTNERKINSTRQSYNTTSGLPFAASQVRTSIPPTVPGGTSYASTNMGIGHSMGGVMIREVDRMPIAGNISAPKKLGGFITIASPNYGAPISANILDGTATSTIATASTKLTAGPIADPVFQPVWILAAGITVYMIIDNLNAIKGYFSQQTNNDLKEGSQAMNNINDYNSYSPVPHKISIIAEENSNVLWRLVGSMNNGAGSSGNPGDQKMVSDMNDVRNFYDFMYDGHRWGLLGIPPLFSLPIANKWKQGRDWLDNSETIWCSLIKSSRVESYQVPTGYWKEVPCGPFPPPRGDKPPDYPYDPDNPFIPGKCYEWVNTGYTTQYTTVTYKNDGLLPTYCQELKGVDSNSGNRYVIDHANHMELKNMTYSKKPNGQVNDGTKNTLNAIFDRPQNTSWWHTPRKTP